VVLLIDTDLTRPDILPPRWLFLRIRFFGLRLASPLRPLPLVKSLCLVNSSATIPMDAGNRGRGRRAVPRQVR